MIRSLRMDSKRFAFEASSIPQHHQNKCNMLINYVYSLFNFTMMGPVSHQWIRIQVAYTLKSTRSSSQVEFKGKIIGYPFIISNEIHFLHLIFNRTVKKCYHDMPK